MSGPAKGTIFGRALPRHKDAGSSREESISPFMGGGVGFEKTALLPYLTCRSEPPVGSAFPFRNFHASALISSDRA